MLLGLFIKALKIATKVQITVEKKKSLQLKLLKFHKY